MSEPWTVEEHSDRTSRYWEVWGSLGSGPSLIIATVRASLAAARLIAAAPEMLALLKRIGNAHRTGGLSTEVVHARALVARIEGRTK